MSHANGRHTQIICCPDPNRRPTEKQTPTQSQPFSYIPILNLPMPVTAVLLWRGAVLELLLTLQIDWLKKGDVVLTVIDCLLLTV